MHLEQALPKRIAMLHYTCPPVVGGVESVMAAHARLFAAAGFQVGVIAGRGPAPQNEPANIQTIIEPLIDSKNEQLLAFNTDLDRGVVPAGFSDLEEAIFRRLKILLAGYDACIVHNALVLHKNLPLTAALLRVAEALPEIKFISWCHDLAWTNELYASVLHDGWPWDLLRTASPHFTYVAISPQRQQEIAATLRPALPFSSIPVVPNGIAFADFLKLGNKTRTVLAAAGLDKAFQDSLILLLPARITRRKNIELAVRVAAELKRQGQPLRMVVTGPPGPHNPKNDEYVRELLALRTQLAVEDEVVFLMERWQDEAGRPRTLSDEVIADLYRCADALFFPSSQEGFGIPILEAGLVRLPIFCTRLEPFVEVADETPCYFQPEDDPAEIAYLIRETLAQNMQFRLRRRVIENYTWESIFEKQIKPLTSEGEHNGS